MCPNFVVSSPITRQARAFIVVALATCLALLALATTAVAKSPTGDFAVFTQCPRFTPGVNFCLYSQTESGEVTLNKQTVPITNTITLQGGIVRNEETEAEAFVGALNGETLSRSPQNVPGGLASLINCNEITNAVVRLSCELVFENGLTGVEATTELARPASEIGINKNNLINEEGTALSLPVRVHLENPFLGGECYVGSSTNPLIVNLTTGTTSPPAPNKPISGKLGTLDVKDGVDFVNITENALVDNAFAGPKTNGCAGIFAFLVDPIIDSKIGLPSPAGKNTAIENNTIKEATAKGVVASEK